MTTHPLDAVREMDKVVDGLTRAVTYLARCNEADAALHMSDQVRYWPLTAIAENARCSAERVRTYLQEQAERSGTARSERRSPDDRTGGI